MKAWQPRPRSRPALASFGRSWAVIHTEDGVGTAGHGERAAAQAPLKATSTALDRIFERNERRPLWQGSGTVRNHGPPGAEDGGSRHGKSEPPHMQKGTSALYAAL